MAIELTDDGTMDTVVRCSVCREEFRFNYDGCPEEHEHGTCTHYDGFVQECIDEIDAEHGDCAAEAHTRDPLDDDGRDYADPGDFKKGYEG